MFNFRTIVRVLAEHNVEFAIVGGLAGVMQGAPIHTKDLDILYSLLPPNPSRLLSALEKLDAIEVKKKLSRPKDQLALLQLVATLEERGKKGH